MLNNMSLTFIFAMLVELTTDSKSASIILPMVTVCLPLLWTARTFQYIEIVELLITSIMSVSMSVMLIGMLTNQVVWLIQISLVFVEVLLFLSIRQLSST
ncbi:hypothetical protein [Alicyclobacillus ferrooxydans]|uniref:Uncharacterized protein n=1 Tax=Alicyclobacillus ferrooxydans TaxID=471514 RepID=A0A0P9GP21_9BACL|nr:hypothetical protein [Alicyclobacillus ferrooxydans]KPV42326.1 hypothetical protein AN477_18710 [Alicyclobacillus ferrooxydans]